MKNIRPITFGLSGRIMHCGIYFMDEAGQPFCATFGPACQAQKRCRTEPRGQLKVCSQHQKVYSAYYRKMIDRCKRYVAVCAEGPCLTEPVTRPKPKMSKLTFQTTVRGMAKSLAEDFNFAQEATGAWLAREILSRGGIAPYRGRYLKEEYKAIPLRLRDSTGLAMDEMAAEMGMDEAQLLEALRKEYPSGRRKVRRKTWRDFEETAYGYVMRHMEEAD